jgi:hypothetical protein
LKAWRSLGPTFADLCHELIPGQFGKGCQPLSRFLDTDLRSQPIEQLVGDLGHDATRSGFQEVIRADLLDLVRSDRRHADTPTLW